MFSVRHVGRQKRLSQPPTRPRIFTGGAGNWNVVLLVKMSPRKSFSPTMDSTDKHTSEARQHPAGTARITTTTTTLMMNMLRTTTVGDVFSPKRLQRQRPPHPSLCRTRCEISSRAWRRRGNKSAADPPPPSKCTHKNSEL